MAEQHQKKLYVDETTTSRQSKKNYMWMKLHVDFDALEILAIAV